MVRELQAISLMTNWITYRRPTEADGDEDGDVRVRYSPYSEDYVYLHWSHVGADVPWTHCATWQPPAPASKPEPTTATPRKFVALTRTVHEFGQIIDAIDEDGVAWWMLKGSGDVPDVEWTQLTPLPARDEVPADA